MLLTLHKLNLDYNRSDAMITTAILLALLITLSQFSYLVGRWSSSI